MSTRKFAEQAAKQLSPTPPLKKTVKSKGTVMAAKIRAKTNHLGDNQREQLMGRALELVSEEFQGRRCEAPVLACRPRRIVRCGKLADYKWVPRHHPENSQPMCSQHVAVIAGNFTDEIQSL